MRITIFGILIIMFAILLASFASATISSVTLSAPDNGTWIPDTMPLFSFTGVTTLNTTISCLVTADGSSVGINATTENSTMTTIPSNTSFSEGSIFWNVTCTDANNSLTSNTFEVQIDETDPEGQILTPSDNAWITDTTPEISFNMTDNLASVINYTLYVDGNADLNDSDSPDTTIYFNTSSLSQGTHTVLASLVDEAYNNYNTSTISFTVDTSAPSIVNITYPDMNETWENDPNLEISFVIIDNLGYNMSYVIYVDDAHNTNGTTSNSTETDANLVTVSEGEHTLIVQGTDEAGNSANSTELTFYIDTVPPNATIFAPGNDTWTTDTTPEIIFNTSDNNATNIFYTVWIDGSSDQMNMSANGVPVAVNTTSTLSEGMHTLIIEVQDEAGSAVNTTPNTFWVDNTPPNPAVISVPENATSINDDTPQITFTMTDNLAPTLFYDVFVDGFSDVFGDGANGSAVDVNLSSLTEGWHMIIVETEDEAGFYVNSTPLYINIDTTEPTSTINNPSNDTWTTDTTPLVAFTLTDETDDPLNYTIYVDGVADVTGYTTNDTLTGVNLTLNESIHEIIVEAYDDAGNYVNSTPLTLNVDNTAPTSNITSPSNGTVTNDNTPTISFSWSDNVDTEMDFTLYVNGVLNDTDTTSGGLDYDMPTLADGTYVIIGQMTDEVGLSTNSSPLTITIDTSVPTSNITSPLPNAWTTDTTPEIGFILTDNSATINYTVYVDGSADVTGTTNNATLTYVNISSVSEAAHTIIVMATDEVGNDFNSTSQTLYVDNSAPSSTIAYPTNASWVTESTPTLSFTVTDNLDTSLDYTVYVNGVLNSTGTSISGSTKNITLGTLAEGSNEIIVMASDEVGFNTNSSLLTFYVDTIAPSVNLVLPANGSNSTNLGTTFNFTNSDAQDSVLDYVIYINGTSNATGTTTPTSTQTTLSLETGWYTTVVQLTDDAGNAQNSSTSVFLVSDVIPPTTAPTLSSADDTDDDGNIELSWTTDSDAANYNVYRDTSNITDATNLTAIGTTASTSYEDLTSIHGTTYWYAITSVDAAGNENKSVVSNSLEATANDATNPALPTDVDAETQSNGAILVNWTAVTLDDNDQTEKSVTYNVFRTDNVSTLNTSSSANRLLYNSTDLEYTDTNITTDETYFYVVTVYDSVGNYNDSTTTNVEVNATECTTSYGSWSSWSACTGTKTRTRTRTCYGGGDTEEIEAVACSTSSGSTTPPNTPDLSQSTTWTFVTPGSSGVMKLSNDEIGFKQIMIKVKNSAENVKITVTKLAGKPTKVSHEVGGNVYQYLEVNKLNLPDDKVDGMIEVQFEVSKSWLQQNGLDKDGIRLYHYTTTWDELQTMIESETVDSFIFKALTPSFSYFAIAGEEGISDTVVVPETEPVVTQDDTTTIDEVSTPESEPEDSVVDTTEEDMPTPKEMMSKPRFKYWAAIIILVIIVVLVIFEIERKKRLHHW